MIVDGLWEYAIPFSSPRFDHAGVISAGIVLYCTMVAFVTNNNDMIWWTILTCAQKLTCSQLSLPHNSHLRSTKWNTCNMTARDYCYNNRAKYQNNLPSKCTLKTQRHNSKPIYQVLLTLSFAPNSNYCVVTTKICFVGHKTKRNQ